MGFERSIRGITGEHCYTRHFPSNDSNEKTQAQKLKDQLLNIVVQAERPELAEDKAWGEGFWHDGMR